MNIQLNPQIAENINFIGRRKTEIKDIEKITKNALSISPNELTIEAKNYVKKAHNLIEDTWTNIKNKKINLETPFFTKEISRRQASLFPLYGSGERRIVLQLHTKKGYERIIVDKNGNNFAYENVIKTEFGSATTKAYNSNTSTKDKDMVTYINTMIETYLPKLVI